MPQEQHTFARTIEFDRYAEAHANLKGPGDARPTALQIVQDENLKSKLSNKVIIMTGGSSGIAIETVRALAHTGVHIITTVRNIKKGQEVVENILAKNKDFDSTRLELLEIDLNSLKSVRKAAGDFLSKHNQLNILSNNGRYQRRFRIPHS